MAADRIDRVLAGKTDRAVGMIVGDFDMTVVFVDEAAAAGYNCVGKAVVEIVAVEGSSFVIVV